MSGVVSSVSSITGLAGLEIEGARDGPLTLPGREAYGLVGCECPGVPGLDPRWEPAWYEFGLDAAREPGLEGGAEKEGK